MRDVWALLVFVLVALDADFALSELLLRAGVFFEVDLAAVAGFIPGASFFVVFVVVLLFAAGFFLGLVALFAAFFV